MNIEKCSSRGSEVCGPALRGNIVLYYTWARTDSSRQDSVAGESAPCGNAAPRRMWARADSSRQDSGVREPAPPAQNGAAQPMLPAPRGNAAQRRT